MPPSHRLSKSCSDAALVENDGLSEASRSFQGTCDSSCQQEALSGLFLTRSGHFWRGWGFHNWDVVQMTAPKLCLKILWFFFFLFCPRFVPREPLPVCLFWLFLTETDSWDYLGWSFLQVEKVRKSLAFNHLVLWWLDLPVLCWLIISKASEGILGVLCIQCCFDDSCVLCSLSNPDFDGKRTCPIADIGWCSIKSTD